MPMATLKVMPMISAVVAIVSVGENPEGEKSEEKPLHKKENIKRDLLHLSVNGVFVTPFAVFPKFQPFVVPLGIFSGYVVSPLALGASQGHLNPFRCHPSPLKKF